VAADLHGRVAVVTGATGGLGRVVAATFASQGASVALLSSNQASLDGVARDLRLESERCLTYAADMRDPAAVSKAAEAVESRFGHIHVLAHLVGGWVGGADLVSSSADDLRAMLDQHVWTTFHMIQAFVPRLVASGWGRVFVVSSPVTVQPAAKSGPYATAKAAEEALLLTLAQEVRGSGVTANVLQVRAIDVDHQREREPSASNAGWALPEEIAAAMLFLCSPDGARLNGTRLPLVG
jgi:2-hydroxycyclohexanecarboxyl-CoA dehydrogenase